MLTQDDKKRAVAVNALSFVDESMVLGVGTGSTVNHFIAALVERRIRPRA
ncbi:MAG: ribose 5-phosphate isomerase A, partial [Proteobacteria bacterium]|nr:ribose 5-phosphate isomerase A [Pseudomonadota bacterium]